MGVFHAGLAAIQFMGRIDDCCYIGREELMHNCDVPGDVLDDWLTAYPTVTGNYGHLLLEQTGENNGQLVEAFKSYFESAHMDARERFHEQIGLDLHPDAGAPGAHAEYPGCLPSTAKRGLFGEVMAGMLTEHYEFVGNYEWTVPIFLFRHHEDVERYLFALARDPARARTVFGRFGTDFVAIALDEHGQVVRYLAGEAKWRKSLTQAAVDTLLLGKNTEDDDGNEVRSGGIWDQLNVDTEIPHGLRQLQRLLEERDPDTWSAAIFSLDRALLVTSGQTMPRTNLVLISGNGSADREEATTLIDWEKKPPEYTAPHDLQVVELILCDGEELIEDIYASLWKDN